MKALVVFSGGQDSSTCLGWALANKDYEEVCAVTFWYGQRHVAEVGAAQAVREHFERKTGRKIRHELIELPGTIFAGTSPLTNQGEQLERYVSHEEMEKIIGDRVEKTFVPMRNAVFLMLAANRAAAWCCGAIVTGVCQGDNANYPDCREEFIDSAETTINQALGNVVLQERPWPWLQVDTPLMHLSKAETCELALELPHTYEALAYSHTAYDGSFPPNGDDHASVLRAEGFRQANMPDPLVLRAAHMGLCPLPETENYGANAVPVPLLSMTADWGPGATAV